MPQNLNVEGKFDDSTSEVGVRINEEPLIDLSDENEQTSQFGVTKQFYQSMQTHSEPSETSESSEIEYLSCGKCCQQIPVLEKHMTCDMCQEDIHLACTTLSEDQHESHEKIQSLIIWLCEKCIPEYSRLKTEIPTSSKNLRHSGCKLIVIKLDQIALAT